MGSNAEPWGTPVLKEWKLELRPSTGIIIHVFWGIEWQNIALTPIKNAL